MRYLEISMLVGSIITAFLTDQEPNPLKKLGVFFLVTCLLYTLLCVYFFVGKALT